MIVAVVQGFSLFAIVVFLGYVATIIVPYVRHRPGVTGDDTAFDWHFFIPARDEQAVIGATVMRLRETFPHAHAWVIDDDSDDLTAEIVGRLLTDPFVHLVQRRRPWARTGKGDALNAAYRALSEWLPGTAERTRIIVGVLDADGTLAPDALRYVAAPRVFGDPVVGGAQISVRMYPAHAGAKRVRGRRFARYLVRMQDLEFVGSIAAMQMLREQTGTVGLGGNGQFSRLRVLDELDEAHGSPWHGALLEDFELGVHILLAGYQNRFVFDTEVHQEAVESVRRLIAQRTRWSQGTMQCSLLYLRQVMRSPRLTNAGAVESSYFLIAPWTQLFGVIFWPILYCVFAYRAYSDPSGLASFAGSYWYLGVLGAITGIGPFVVWGPIYRRKVDPSMSRRSAFALGLGYAAYLYYTYPTTIRAFARLVTRRNGWAKTRRNSEVVLSGPVAQDA